MSSKSKDLILAVNAGSSSLKISLYRLNTSQNAESSQNNPVALILTSTIENISSPPASFSFTHNDSSKTGKDTKKQEIKDIQDHSSAFEHFLVRLKQDGGVDREAIRHVCHRVVHGGDYNEPVIISSEAYHHLEKLTDLAPLHNGAALSVIHATLKQLPKATSIAYFDTTFHRTIPPHISTYPLDPSVAGPRGLKKYGFHGLSYAYILRSVSRHLKKSPSEVSLIVLHLGSGASACAIANGKSLDTSMGLTPLHGLPGATRAGALDPATIFHYTNKAGKITHDKSQAVAVDVTEAEEILNKKAGWKALTGTSDFGEIVKDMVNDEKKKLAFDLFVDRILDYVGSYYVKLRGNLDALVFAGGIGERSPELRSAVVDGVAALGLKLSDDANANASQVEDEAIDISGGGKYKVIVCRTNEQEEMARECAIEKRFWD